MTDEDRIEAVLRAHGMHEPDCKEFLRIERQRKGPDIYLLPEWCTCWLSDER